MGRQFGGVDGLCAVPVAGRSDSVLPDHPQRGYAQERARIYARHPELLCMFSIFFHDKLLICAYSPIISTRSSAFCLNLPIVVGTTVVIAVSESLYLFQYSLSEHTDSIERTNGICM